VFCQNGLVLTMVMGTAAVAATWLATARTQAHFLGIPPGITAGGLIAVAILCKGLAGILLTLGGALLGPMLRWYPYRVLVMVLILLPPAYMFARGTGAWDGQEAISVAQIISPRRAASLETRLENERRIVDKAMRRPVLGWGRWGRWRVVDEHGRDITRSDGLWVIVLGEAGLAGLLAFSFAWLLPPFRLARTVPIRVWMRPSFAPAAVMTVIVCLHMMDNLLNAFPSPVFAVALGGVATFPTAYARLAPRVDLVRRRARAARAARVKPATAAAGGGVA